MHKKTAFRRFFDLAEKESAHSTDHAISSHLYKN
jgi:hypothetical protein